MDNQTEGFDIEVIKNDASLRNEFIIQYQPFIASFTSKVASRFVSYGEDEELSIALLAFNEAIDRFNGNGNFLAYAKLLIRNRLLDYFKSRTHRERQISSSLYDEEDEEIPSLKNNAIDQFKLQQENEQRLSDIQEYSAQLSVFGISFSDLVDVSPKHLLTRHQVNKCIALLVENKEIIASLLRTQQLPMKEIEKISSLPRKKLERYRKYIIAGILLAHSDYESLKFYLPFNHK